MFSFIMENNISTTYVPLQPPYQIIKYGKDIGMQIGTLIVVKEPSKQVPVGNRSSRSLRIETHSYPVVTYGNKLKASKDKHLFEKDFTEGVVWNRVELRHVSTICLSDSHLPWKEFIDMLWSDISRTSYQSAPDIDSLSALCDLGVMVEPLSSGTYVLHIQTYCGDEIPTMVRTDREDPLAINVFLKDDLDAMVSDIRSQVNAYIVNMIFHLPSGKGRPHRFQFEYTTDEEILKPLVDKLNLAPTPIGIGSIKMKLQVVENRREDKSDS